MPEAVSCRTVRRQLHTNGALHGDHRSDQRVLGDDLLQSFGERAPTYDRENRFFVEDFDELKRAGYLDIAVPTELEPRVEPGASPPGAAAAGVPRPGGRWRPTCTSTGRAWPPTCCARAMRRAGGCSRSPCGAKCSRPDMPSPGNAFPPLLSTHASQGAAEGGYRLYGHKIFGSLTTVWTRLGVHAMDTSDPAQPKIVHASLPRDGDGFRIVPTWDVMGMRATRSPTTPSSRAPSSPTGTSARGPGQSKRAPISFVLSIFAWAEPTFANIYLRHSPAGDRSRRRQLEEAKSRSL